MDIGSVFGSGIFTWVILPFLIFLARAVDVSLGTIRIVFVSRGLRFLAPVVGFFEVIIWLLAIRVIMQNLDNAVCYIAYGAGFAMGTFIGLHIEKRMAIGTAIVRIITHKDSTPLIDRLRKEGFGVTSLDAQGKKGLVHVLFMIIRRCDFEKVAKIIQQHNPKAFYTVEDTRIVSEGFYPNRKSRLRAFPIIRPAQFWRKGK